MQNMEILNQQPRKVLDKLKLGQVDSIGMLATKTIKNAAPKSLGVFLSESIFSLVVIVVFSPF